MDSLAKAERSAKFSGFLSFGFEEQSKGTGRSSKCIACVAASRRLSLRRLTAILPTGRFPLCF